MSSAATALLKKLMYTKALDERVGGIDSGDVLAGKELFDSSKPYASVLGTSLGKTMLGNVRSNPVQQDRIDPAQEYAQAVRFFV